MNVEVEDTYAEAFDGLFCRVVITADDEEVLTRAAEDATATPSIVLGRIEGGIERRVNVDETPDGRRGMILQFWGGIKKGTPIHNSVDKFGLELSYRIRQDILVKPFTALYNALLKPSESMDMMERVGHCGDGFEWEEKYHGRNMIVVPLMVSNFLIERKIGYAIGVMGANFWYLCKTKRAVTEAGRKALKAIRSVDGVITPFDVCSAGSKPETNFPWIGPTTNHPYCPTLKKKLGEESKVPEDVRYIPEIVINGTSLETVKEAMTVGIQSILDVSGVLKISAGNYGGKIGGHKIQLRGLLR